MILDQIVAAKKEEVALAKTRIPESVLRERLITSPTRSLAAALRGEDIRVIAEVKKASPSKGLLCPGFSPSRLAKSYEAGGAAAVSVLTDQKFFQGAPEDLTTVRQSCALPVLRKDFVIDPYQLYEARCLGADAVLLIVAILTDVQLNQYLAQAQDLGLECLVEVHDEAELFRAINAGAPVIGINNRDLRTFETTLETTYRLAPLIPGDRVIVSESGINSATDIQLLAGSGVNAVLVGESIVKAEDPQAKVQELAAAGTRCN